jgi:uncharacterized protein
MHVQLCGAMTQTIPSTNLRDNLFLVPLDADARWMVYAPLQKVAFVANARMVNRIADFVEGNGERDAELSAWLREMGVAEGAAALPQDSFSGPPHPTSVTLFLTTACNLRCTYCYASTGQQPVESLDLETAKRGIDVVIGNAIAAGAREIGVAFHGGGEPSVAWAVLTGSLEHARAAAAERGLGVSASITTNAVLSEPKARWIAENLNFATVSCDGLPEVQDRNRLTVLGSGSSGQVTRTLKVFDTAGFRYGLRLTVTPADVASLPDSVAHLCAAHRPEVIQVEPAHQLGRWEGRPAPEVTAFIEAFREARARAAEYGRRVAFSAARLDVRSRHFCGVSRDTFAVAPGGGVSACYEVFSRRDEHAGTFFYGSLTADGLRVDVPALDRLREQTVDARAHCQSCFAKWHCSGDCYHKVLLAGGAEFTGTDRCHITRELLKDALLERIAGSGGLVWRGEAGACVEAGRAGRAQLAAGD